MIHKINYYSKICAAGVLKPGEGKVSPEQEVEGCLGEPGAWPLNGKTGLPGQQVTLGRPPSRFWFPDGGLRGKEQKGPQTIVRKDNVPLEKAGVKCLE